MTVYINGKKYNTPPNANISMVNDKVYANGKLIEDTKNLEEKEINITIHGDAGNIENTHGTIHVHGNTQSIHTQSGKITIGKDSGSIQTMSGRVTVSGSVNGNVSTMSGIIQTK